MLALFFISIVGRYQAKKWANGAALLAAFIRLLQEGQLRVGGLKSSRPETNCSFADGIVEA